MPITLTINGTSFANFKRSTASLDLENAANTFSFTGSLVLDNRSLIFPNAFCEVSINGEQVIQGRIEKFKGSQKPNTYEVTLSGRDVTADIVDSTLNENMQLNTPVSLQSIGDTIISSLGSELVSVIAEPTLANFTASEIISANIGESALRFLEKYARKRARLVNTDGRGNLTISEVNRAPIPRAKLTMRLNDIAQTNTILESDIDVDISERFNEYRAYTQLNVSATQIGSLVSQVFADVPVGVAVDEDIDEGRVLSFIAENVSQPNDLRLRAEWERDVRRARSFTYTCVVAGFSIPGSNQLLSPNKTVRVVDEGFGIDDDLLIKSAEYEESESNGEHVKLTMTLPEAYSIELAKPVSANVADVLGIF